MNLCASVYKNDAAWYHIGNPDQIEGHKEKLKQHIHRTQHKTIKFAFKHRITHIPCLHEKNHRQSVAQYGNAV